MMRDAGGTGMILAPMSDPALAATHRFIRLRIARASQELGVLLIAFAPLDAAFAAPVARGWRIVVGFVVAGVLLFAFGVREERRVAGER